MAQPVKAAPSLGGETCNARAEPVQPRPCDPGWDRVAMEPHKAANRLPAQCPTGWVLVARKALSRWDSLLRCRRVRGHCGSQSVGLCIDVGGELLERRLVVDVVGDELRELLQEGDSRVLGIGVFLHGGFYGVEFCTHGLLHVYDEVEVRQNEVVLTDDVIQLLSVPHAGRRRAFVGRGGLHQPIP